MLKMLRLDVAAPLALATLALLLRRLSLRAQDLAGARRLFAGAREIAQRLLVVRIDIQGAFPKSDRVVQLPVREGVESAQQVLALQELRDVLIIRIREPHELALAEGSPLAAKEDQQQLGATLRAEIDYGFAQARTTYGIIGVKVWIFTGYVPDARVRERKLTVPGEELAS